MAFLQTHTPRAVETAVATGLALLLLAGGSGGCSKPQAEIQPARLRVSALPSQSVETLRERYGSLLGHLSAELKLPCDLVLYDTYEQLLDAFVARKIDLAFFGGVTFVMAADRGGAVPLVMRDVDRQFTTVFLASARDRRRRPEEFRGARFTFGTPLSASGHAMPRVFLAQQGIEPETFFGSVGYSGGHERTALRVRDGLEDLGAANAAAIEQMYSRGEIRRDQVKVLWETRPFVDYVWAATPTLPDRLRLQIRDAFLALSTTSPAHAAVLSDLGAGGYLPASADDFSEMREVVRLLPAAGRTRAGEP